MMSRDGQYREARCFTEEGVYILSILAQTPNAREFRSRVAAMLRELRSSRFQISFPLPPNPPGVRAMPKAGLPRCPTCWRRNGSRQSYACPASQKTGDAEKGSALCKDGAFLPGNHQTSGRQPAADRPPSFLGAQERPFASDQGSSLPATGKSFGNGGVT